MDEFMEGLEEHLKSIIEKAKQDHKDDTLLDPSFLFEDDDNDSFQSIDDKKLKKVLGDLKEATATKDGVRRVITIVSLAIKYANKYLA